MAAERLRIAEQFHENFVKTSIGHWTYRGCEPYNIYKYVDGPGDGFQPRGPARLERAGQFGGLVRNSIPMAAIGAVVLLVGSAAPVAAQSKGVDVTAAYQFQRSSCSDCGDATNFPAGFSVDAAGTINSMWSWVGAVDFGRKIETKGTVDVSNKVTFYGAGARWTAMGSGMAMPFVQVLVGAGYHQLDASAFGVAGETNFTFGIDGGVAVPVTSNKRTSFVAQVGYRRIKEDPGLNVIRFDAGLRWKLGGQ